MTTPIADNFAAIAARLKEIENPLKTVEPMTADEFYGLAAAPPASSQQHRPPPPSAACAAQGPPSKLGRQAVKRLGMTYRKKKDDDDEF